MRIEEMLGDRPTKRTTRCSRGVLQHDPRRTSCQGITENVMGRKPGENPTQKKKHQTSRSRARQTYYPQDWRWARSMKWIHYMQS